MRGRTCERPLHASAPHIPARPPQAIAHEHTQCEVVGGAVRSPRPRVALAALSAPRRTPRRGLSPAGRAAFLRRRPSRRSSCRRRSSCDTRASASRASSSPVSRRSRSFVRTGARIAPECLTIGSYPGHRATKPAAGCLPRLRARGRGRLRKAQPPRGRLGVSSPRCLRSLATCRRSLRSRRLGATSCSPSASSSRILAQNAGGSPGERPGPRAGAAIRDRDAWVSLRRAVCHCAAPSGGCQTAEGTKP
jgi:hypothetical protein